MAKESLRNRKKNDEKVNRIYGRPVKSNSWSDMHSQYPTYGHEATISDLESISLCMEYPTRPTPIRSQFDTKPIRIQSNKNRSPQSTSPPSPSSSKMCQPRSPSLLYNSQSLSKFRLEKIPEVPPTPISTTASVSTASNDSPDNSNPVDDSANSENSPNHLITTPNEVE